MLEDACKRDPALNLTLNQDAVMLESGFVLGDTGGAHCRCLCWRLEGLPALLSHQVVEGPGLRAVSCFQPTLKRDKACCSSAVPRSPSCASQEWQRPG